MAKRGKRCDGCGEPLSGRQRRWCGKKCRNRGPRKARFGSRAPKFKHLPEFERSEGQDAIDLASHAGLILDPWQQDVVFESFGVRDDVRAATEYCLICPRQNGKGAILEAVVLHALFTGGRTRILWSSHEFKTSRESFIRLRALIEGSPTLKKRVKSIRTANGQEGIELKDRSELKFVARSKGSGRGFAADLVILDEAMILDDAAISALFPTLAARKGQQIWYVSSAPLMTSQVLRRVALRGRSGEDKHLAYWEWCADEKAESTDRSGWLGANPGMGYRLTLDFTAKELGGMDEEDFRRERLGIWAEEGSTEPVVDLDRWDELADYEEDVPLDPIALAVDVSPDDVPGGTRSAISAAGRRGDDLVHVENLEDRRGTKWVVDRVVELHEKHRPCAILIDGRSPGAFLIPALKAKGFETTKEPQPGTFECLVETSSTDLSRACKTFYEAVEDGALRHFDQDELREALENATRRPLGDAWVWSRKTSRASIAALVAATLAHHGLGLYGETEELVPLVAVR